MAEDLRGASIDAVNGTETEGLKDYECDDFACTVCISKIHSHIDLRRAADQSGYLSVVVLIRA